MNRLDVNITIEWQMGEYERTIISFQTICSSIKVLMQKIYSEIENIDEVPETDKQIKNLNIYAYKSSRESDYRTLRISGKRN